MRAGQRRIRTLQWTVALTILLALFVARPAGAQPGGDPSVLPPGAKLETLFSGAFFTEGVDGSVTLIITDAGKPNGVAVSPDQKTLYVVSNDNGAIGWIGSRRG